MSDKEERDKPARRPRRPNIKTLLKESAQGGKTVTSITLPDGTHVVFSESKPTAAEPNSWNDIYAADTDRPA